MITVIALLSIILVLSYIYIKGKNNERYWKKRGVVFHDQNKATGPIMQYATTNRPLFDILHEIYTKYPNEPAVGLGNIVNRQILIKHPENVLHVMQNDFLSFYHRGGEINKKNLLADNILFMNGVRWKLTRQIMSPLFTAAKLKHMFYIIDKSAQDFVEYIEKHPELRNGNAYNTLTTFCSAAVCAAVFGITSESIFDCPFLAMVRSVMKPSLWSTIRSSLTMLFPKLNKIINLSPFTDYQDFFIGAIKQLLRQREKENVSKHDFADICLKIQKSGTVQDKESGYKLEPTDELLAAQGFFFILAGVEPCAVAFFTTLVELGWKTEILKKVQKEIDDTFDKYNGKMSYDALAEMDYLECVLNESMRKNPPIGLVVRRCMKDSVLPVGNIPIEAGTRMVIPIYDIQNDEKYFPNPEVFEPDRFKDTNHDVSFMPFGKGNRLCIGARYGKLQVKAGLVHFLRHFSIETVKLENAKKYVKQVVQVRMENVDCKFIPRKL